MFSDGLLIGIAIGFTVGVTINDACRVAAHWVVAWRRRRAHA